MKVKATVSFVGIVSMRKGEERDLKDHKILDDLLRAGYVETIEKPEPPKEAKEAKKKTSRKGR